MSDNNDGLEKKASNISELFEKDKGSIGEKLDTMPSHKEPPQKIDDVYTSLFKACLKEAEDFIKMEGLEIDNRASYSLAHLIEEIDDMGSSLDMSENMREVFIRYIVKKCSSDDLQKSLWKAALMGAAIPHAVEEVNLNGDWGDDDDEEDEDTKV